MSEAAEEFLEPSEALGQAMGMLSEEAVADIEPAAEPAAESTDEAPPEATPGEEPAAEATQQEATEEPQGAPEDNTSDREQLIALLRKMPEDERNDLLGANSRAFAALRHQRNQHEAQQAELARTAQEVAQQKQQIDELLARAKKNPFEALKLGDWTEEDLAEALETDGKPGPAKMIRELEERQRAQFEEVNGRLAQREYELNMERWHAGVRSTVASADPKEFALARRYEEVRPGSIVRKIVDIQNNYFLQHGQTLDPMQALGYVESHLRSERDLLAPQAAVPVQTGSVKPAKSEAEKEPLPNGQMQSGSFASSTPIDDDSEEIDSSEALRRAMAILRGGG